MSKKIVRATARVILAGCLVAAAFVLGASPAVGGELPGNDGSSGNSVSWIGG